LNGIKNSCAVWDIVGQIVFDIVWGVICVVPLNVICDEVWKVICNVRWNLKGSHIEVIPELGWLWKGTRLVL
jgi:hypothetical protein